jgi:molecular chaperone GrpE
MSTVKDKDKDKSKGKEPEAPEYKDKWLRALADYENLKKRAEKEKTETIRYSNQFLIIELFPIMDSFDSAMSAIKTSEDKESFVKGLTMLQKEFHRILEVNGLQKVKTVGEKFDPNVHQADGEVCSEEFDAGVVAEEIRSGYMLNERLLRPALVKVSKGTKDEGRETKDDQ